MSEFLIASLEPAPAERRPVVAPAAAAVAAPASAPDADWEPCWSSVISLGMGTKSF